MFNTNPTLVLLQLQENEILSNKEDIDIVIIRCQAKFFVCIYLCDAYKNLIRTILPPFYTGTESFINFMNITELIRWEVEL